MPFVFMILIAFGLSGATTFAKNAKTKNLPQAFYKSEILILPKSCKKLEEIFYEVHGFGRFFVKQFTQNKDRIEVQYFPPTYKQEIFWKATCDKQKFLLKKVRYKHPVPKLKRANVYWQGNGTAPFFMSNESVRKKNKLGRVFPIVWNKWGETVWAYEDGFILNKHLHGVLLNEVLPGEWIFLGSKKTTKLIHMKLNGKILKNINFQKENLPAISHNFMYDANKERLTYLKYDCREISKSGWSKPVSHLGSILFQLDLSNKKTHSLWTTFDTFDPLKTKSLFIGPTLSTDRFRDIENEYQFQSLIKDPLVWYDWQDKNCHTDWSHENSIDFHPARGYLISARNFNKLILWDPIKNISKTIGSQPDCDFCIPEDKSFSMQHSALFLNENEILLFDNNSIYRSFIGPRYANRLMLLELSGGPEIKKVTIKKTIKIKGLQALIKGSVSVLPNGNWLAYMPGNAGSEISFVEINPQLGTEVFRLNSYSRYSYHAIESKPFFSLNGETYEAIQDSSLNLKESPTSLSEQVEDLAY